MATGNYVLGNNTRHYNWPKILLITALLSVLATAIIVPIAIVSSQQGTIDDNGDRISCFPLTEFDLNKADCESHGCKWDAYGKHVKCYIDPQSYGYEVVKVDNDLIGTKVELRRRQSPSLYGGDFENVVFQVTQYTDDMMRFSFYSASKSIEENQPPVPLNIPKPSATAPKYEIRFNQTEGSPFEFQIVRKSSGTVLLDTKLGGLTIAEQFLMITFGLPSSFLYGIGENTHSSFVHDMNYKMWPIFARDQPTGDGELNLYGCHPFYTVSEDDGSSHGVFFFNSHSIDVTTLPAPGLTYRTIGGGLDFFVFLGPKPESVIDQYTQLIGRPMIPPYWALGFQISRYGYNSTEDIKEVVDRTKKAGIPQDIQYADIDYMDYRADFTIGKNFKDLPTYVSTTSADGLRFIVIIDHVVNTERSNYATHTSAMEKKVYITWGNATTGLQPEANCTISPHNCQDLGDVMLGYLWPDGKTAIPDFLKTNTTEWWNDQFVKFYEMIKFDGIWIDMNEPSNFDTNLEKPFNWPEGKPSWNLICPENKWDDPPYKTLSAKRTVTGRLSDKTLCMIGQQGQNNEFMHYQVHNVYGWSETVATYNSLRKVMGKRNVIISRSTFPSSGKYAGHWLGDNTSRWKDLHASIIGLLEFNMFGIPYVGADICGFNQNTTEQLCQRWMELGAFYPFSRNHNSENLRDQDPAVWSAPVIDSSRNALNIRYKLLPYLYTLFYHSRTTGSTVVRPLYHEFSNDLDAKMIDTQFLWGPALLISPVLTENETDLKVYLPNCTWYDYYTEQKVADEDIGHSVMYTPLEKINLHIRGGHILPTQKEALNTKLSRKNNFGLIIALDENGEAKGSLFRDDDESLDTVESSKFNHIVYAYSKNELKQTAGKQGYVDDQKHTVEEIKILGLNQKPKSIEKDKVTIPNDKWTYNTTSMVLFLSGQTLSLQEDWSIILQMQ